MNEEYCKYLRGVVDKLFKSMSKGLGLEEDELKEVANEEEMLYLLKINYYPPCPLPDLVLGVPPHTDMSYLTILVPNEVQGLQASRDGRWYDVKYVPNALVIHVGDQMEVNLTLSLTLTKPVIRSDLVRFDLSLSESIQPTHLLANQKNSKTG